MNARDETDLGNDTRLVDAMRECLHLAFDPFVIKDEIAKVTEQWNAGARVADDCFCSDCGARGYVYRCPNCERG